MTDLERAVPVTTTPTIYESRAYRTLLCNVLANPADDLARLVIADWLEEHGEADRAEFIRLQCAGESNLNGVLGDLWENYILYHAWCDYLPANIKTAWSRGFVSHVSCTLAQWDQHGPQLVTRHPITSVVLTDGRLEHVSREPGFPEWRVRFPDNTCTHYFNFSMSKDTEKELSQWAIQRAIFAALPACSNEKCGKPITAIHRGMAKCPCGYTTDLWQHLLGLTRDER
jgi:uncharacterized protein (TIGR02996 family)